MISPTAIDLFAGLGGTTEGAKQAGYRVLWAGNHWRAACDWHEINHPETEVDCQDLRQYDFAALPKHDVMLASPSCKGHTNARGKNKRRHLKERATMWAVVDCAEEHQEEAIVIEQVPGVLAWKLWPAFERAMKLLGYTLSVHIVDAADHGVPQHRVRSFIIGTRSKAPLILKLPRRHHVPFRSIMESGARWSPVARPGRAAATLARVEAGREQFGRNFVMPYYKSGSGLTGRSLDRPIGTVTTVDRWALVRGDKMRMLTVREYLRAMSFPATYKLPADKRTAIHLLGNAVPPRLERDVLIALKEAV